MVVTSRTSTEDTQAVPAAHSVDLCKTYGAGQATVQALAGVTFGLRARPAALATGELLIDSTTAQDKHLAVGDAVPARFALTGPATLRIGGIYQANALIGSFLVSAAPFGVNGS